MIKILFLIETLDAGGAEKVLCELVNHMDQTKFDITVQTGWPYDPSKYLVSGIRYKTMYASASRINHLRYRAETESGLAYRLHVRDDYDIECAYLEMGPTKVLSASTNKKAKKLAWVHCDLLKAVSDPGAYSKKTAPWYAKYDQVVCVSKTVKESFDTIFLNRFQSTVLYNQIDESEIYMLAEEVCPANSDLPVVLAVGSIYPPKNYPRMLAAHRRILEEGLNHVLWILGDGQDRGKIEQIISEQGLEDSVHLFGFRKNPFPFIKRADVLACSSNYEGFSTVITEGIILGKAIVTTDCSGMREILGDSDYGLITENDDEAFYLGLRKMLFDKAMREHYAEMAMQRAKFFSCEQLAAEAEKFFLQVAVS